MKKRILAVLMAASLTVGMLMGCSTDTGTDQTTDGTEDTGDSSDGPVAESELLKDQLVVYIANEAASDWQVISTEYLKALVEAAGGECQIMNPENDASRQAQMVEDALVLQPAAIVIKPIDQAAIVPALQQANAADIPIITLDTGLIEGADVEIACAIQTDQTSLGKTAAEYVEQAAKESGEDAKVITVLGDMSSNIAQLRQSGFNDYAAETDNIEVLAETESKWDPSTAYTAVMDMMTANP